MLKNRNGGGDGKMYVKISRYWLFNKLSTVLVIRIISKLNSLLLNYEAYSRNSNEHTVFCHEQYHNIVPVQLKAFACVSIKETANK